MRAPDALEGSDGVSLTLQLPSTGVLGRGQPTPHFLT